MEKWEIIFPWTVQWKMQLMLLHVLYQIYSEVKYAHQTADWGALYRNTRGNEGRKSNVRAMDRKRPYLLLLLLTFPFWRRPAEETAEKIDQVPEQGIHFLSQWWHMSLPLHKARYYRVSQKDTTFLVLERPIRFPIAFFRPSTHKCCFIWTEEKSPSKWKNRRKTITSKVDRNAKKN